MNSTVQLAIAVGVVAVVATQFLARAPAIVAAPRSTASSPAQGGPKLSEIYADRQGHYRTSVEINHQLVPVLVDTGATTVALTYEDARRIGIVLNPGSFTIPMSTANGTVRAAATDLQVVRLGTIEAQYIKAVVMPAGALSESLLGMTFLGKVSVTVDNNRMILRQS